MAIKGSLKEASLPDVLQLLALGQKTGCLSIADRSNFGYIYFDKGRICYASIVNRRDRLGDILVKHEKISQEQLDAAIHRQSKARDKKLGEILVMQNVLTQQELERYMRMQIEESVFYLFTWTQGTFNFEADVRPEQQDFLVSINPELLLLEGARRVDEWGLIVKKIPSFDLIFLVDRDRLAISDATLTEVQDRLLPLLDGSRDVNQVIEDSGLGEFEVGKALYGLVTAGFLHRAGRTASAEDVKMTDARVEEHRNLGIAFYKTGMLDEAAREFRRVEAGRSRERGRPARPRQGAVRRQCATDLVLGARARRSRGRRLRDRRTGSHAGRRGPSAAWRVAQQSGSAARAGRRAAESGGAGAGGAARRAVAAAALQESRRSGLPRVALR